MPHTRDWDETNPPSSQAAALGATRIRDLKVDIQERMLIDHVWDSTVNDDGLHKQVTMAEQVDPAAPAANYGILYLKDVAGTTHLFMIDSAGTVRQLSGALSGSVAWANITGIPAFVSLVEALTDPGADSYLVWNDTTNELEFRAISASAEFAGFIDGSAGAGVTGVFNAAANGWSVVRAVGGRFTITHNLNLAAVTDLAITATVRINAGGTDDRYATVTNETVNSFDVFTVDIGTGAVDEDFYFKASRLV